MILESQCCVDMYSYYCNIKIILHVCICVVVTVCPYLRDLCVYVCL